MFQSAKASIMKHCFQSVPWLVVLSFVALILPSCGDSNGTDLQERKSQSTADESTDPEALKPAGTVVVYTSVDAEFAEMVLAQLEKDTGLDLSVVTDTEAGKTTGLVQRIQAEADNPRADVFWNSELFNTILLARAGLLEPYKPEAAIDIPERYIDKEYRWTACAVRARVLAFDKSVVNPQAVPAKWSDLAKPEVAPGLAFANPLFGTTKGHVAAMWALWGEDETRKFLTELRSHGAMMVDGNSTAVRKVIAGETRFCATDTDDVIVANAKGANFDMRYLDMGDGGTLLIPCSVSIIKGGPNPEGAKRVVEYLVSAKVEEMLAKSDSHNIPVRKPLRQKLGMDWPAETRVSFDQIADAMEASTQAVREILIR